MKNIIYLILPILLFSCNDFLEEESKDLLIPKTLENFQEFLYGETMCENSDILTNFEYLSDDIEEFYYGNSANEKRSFAYGYFTWSSEPEIGINNDYKKDKAWDELYHDIFTCNVILDQVKNVDCTQKEMNTFLGEVYFMKALKYFYLVNLYGEPYLNDEQAKTALGVPINDEKSIEDNQYRRAALAENYEELEKNILEAINLFENGNEQTTAFRPNIDAAYVLASRIYLYKKDYKNADKYASKAIERKGNKIAEVREFDYAEASFFAKNNTAVLFTFGTFKLANSGEWKNYPGFRYNAYYTSSDLLQLLNDNDRRKTGFFAYHYYPYKYYNNDNSFYGNNIRIEEAYLNRAEAKIMAGKSDAAIQDALEDINTLRKFRIDSDDYELTASNYEDAVNKIRTERRIELCFERHRWFDVRRWQLKLNRSVTLNGNVQQYELNPGDKAYTLPIPKHIRNINPIIERLYK